MGVDYFNCGICGEISGDCGDYGRCCICTEQICQYCKSHYSRIKRRRFKNHEFEVSEWCCKNEEDDEKDMCMDEQYHKKKPKECCTVSGCLLCQDCEDDYEEEQENNA